MRHVASIGIFHDEFHCRGESASVWQNCVDVMQGDLDPGEAKFEEERIALEARILDEHHQLDLCLAEERQEAKIVERVAALDQFFAERRTGGGGSDPTAGGFDPASESAGDDPTHATGRKWVAKTPETKAKQQKQGHSEADISARSAAENNADRGMEAERPDAASETSETVHLGDACWLLLRSPSERRPPSEELPSEKPPPSEQLPPPEQHPSSQCVPFLP